MDQRPIGIFDSGLGGLTAARALAEILPGENLIYFGDSLNAPYGTRSREELTELATANAHFLAGFDCKAVLVACGTVSSNVMDVLRSRFPQIPFFGVVDAPCRSAVSMTKTGRVAVVATDATVRSGAFARTIQALDGSVSVFSDSCQSLVALAERGHFSVGDPLAEQAVAEELAEVKAWGPDVLMLACTHFPLFEDLIADYLGSETSLISVGAEAAFALRGYLEENDMLAVRECGQQQWFTSGSAEDFAAMSAKLLGRSITAQRHINSENTTL